MKPSVVTCLQQLIGRPCVAINKGVGVIYGVQRRVYTLFRGMGLRGLPVLQLGSNTVVGMITRENLSETSIEEYLAKQKVVSLFFVVCFSISSRAMNQCNCYQWVC